MTQEQRHVLGMELDHVAVFTASDGPELAHLRALGLIETYRRRHPGQGTENICFCFDNIFLECLFLTNAAEAQSPAIARTGLFERAHWRATGNSPAAIAWRGPAPQHVPTWDFHPPYLPAGAAIAVATDSDDPRQPLLFASPGDTAPERWPAEKRGVLQHPAGFSRISAITYAWPPHVPPAPALIALAAETILTLTPATSRHATVTLHAERRDGGAPLAITLPVTPLG